MRRQASLCRIYSPSHCPPRKLLLGSNYIPVPNSFRVFYRLFFGTASMRTWYKAVVVWASAVWSEGKSFASSSNLPFLFSPPSPLQLLAAGDVTYKLTRIKKSSFLGKKRRRAEQKREAGRWYIFLLRLWRVSTLWFPFSPCFFRRSANSKAHSTNKKAPPVFL